MMKAANLNQQSLNLAEKTEKRSPLSRLFTITAVLGVAIFNVSCSDEAEETPPVVQEAEPVVKEVCLYPEEGYEGEEKCYTSDQPRFKELGINDVVSSLKVKGGAEASLFQHHNYEGYEVVYKEDTPSIEDQYDNQFSALKVR